MQDRVAGTAGGRRQAPTQVKLDEGACKNILQPKKASTRSVHIEQREVLKWSEFYGQKEEELIEEHGEPEQRLEECTWNPSFGEPQEKRLQATVKCASQDFFSNARVEIRSRWRGNDQKCEVQQES